MDAKALDQQMDIDECSEISGQPEIFETKIFAPTKKATLYMMSDSESQLVQKSRKCEDQQESQLVNVSGVSLVGKAAQKSAY